MKLWGPIKHAVLKSSVVEQLNAHEGNMADIETGVQMYWDQGWKAQGWPTVHDNALKARQEHTMTVFQLGAVTLSGDIEKY